MSNRECYGGASRQRLLHFLTILTLAVGYEQTVLHPVTAWNEKAYERFLYDCIRGLILLQGSAGIVRVQGPALGVWSSGSTITVTMGSTPTPGNLLIMCVGWRTSPNLTSITQTGVTWTGGGNGLQVHKVSAALTTQNDIWLGTAGSGASTSITVNFSSSLSEGVADVCEYSGLAAASTVKDQAAGNTSTSTPHPDSGTTATTTQANELWVASLTAHLSGNTVTQSSPTNSFTLLDGADQNYSGVHYSLGFLERIVSSTGTAQTQVTCAHTPATWVGVIATFIASTASTASGSVHLALSSARKTNQVISGAASIALSSVRKTNQVFSAVANLAVSSARSVSQTVLGAIRIAVGSIYDGNYSQGAGGSSPNFLNFKKVTVATPHYVLGIGAVELQCDGQFESWNLRGQLGLPWCASCRPHNGNSPEQRATEHG